MITRLNKHLVPLICIALFLVSVFLRFWQLGSLPVGLYWDEVAMYVDAKTVSDTGKDMHGNSAIQAIFPSYGDYKLPVYIWLSSGFFKLFGASDWALRAPSATLGVLQGCVVFLLLIEMTRTVLPKKTSLIVSLLGWLIIAISPWSVMFSRTGFEGFSGQLFVLLSILFFFYSKRQKRWLILSTLMGILGVYSYYSVRFVWPVLVVFFTLCFSLKTTLKKKLTVSALHLLCLIIWVVGMFPIFSSPWYAESQKFRLSTDSLLDIAPFSIQSNVYRQVTGNTVVSRVIYHRRVLQARALLKHYANHLDLRYLFLNSDSNLRHSTQNHGLFLLFCLPLLVAGFLYLLSKQPKIFIFLLIWWLIALLPASVPLDTPHALRSLNALSPITLIMAFGSVPFYSLFQKLKKTFEKRLIISLLFATLIVQIFFFAIDYFMVYPAKSAADWQQGYKDIVTTVVPDSKRMDTVWLNPEDDRFFLWFLAYSDLTSTQIQNIMKNQFILHDYDKFHFSEYRWEIFQNQVRPFVVVTRYSQLKQKPEHETTLYSTDGKPKYSVGYYEQK